MEMEKVYIFRENTIGWLVLNNREKRNAIDYEMWLKLPSLLEELNKDGDVRVIILKGEGGHFSAGADMSQFSHLRSNDVVAAKYNEAVAKAHLSLKQSSKPIMAMIEGYCMGGGFGLALHCDIRIADTTGKFSIPAAKRGVGYSYPGVKQLVDLVGPANAFDILYTGRIIPGQEALTMGILNYLIPKGELYPFVSQYGEMISQNAPLTIQAVRMAINECLQQESKRDLAKVEEAVAKCFASKDYQEGYQSFLEKRKPNFEGK